MWSGGRQLQIFVLLSNIWRRSVPKIKQVGISCIADGVTLKTIPLALV
jgi:hypothetical protein